jgi:hypothetical protein
MKTIIAIVAVLLSLHFGSHAADDAAPWGAETGGLVSRLIVPLDYVQGEPIRPVLEVKNVSNADVLVRKTLRWECVQDVKFNVKEPKGKTRLNNNTQHGDLAADAYKALKPQEVQSYPADDLRFIVVSGMRMTGEYELTASYTLSKPVEKEAHADYRERIKASIVGDVVAPKVKLQVRELKAGDLRVHEWGVFTVYTEMKLANAGMKAEWNSLPDFFYRQFPTYRLKWSPSAWDKPIIYFYAQRHLDLTVTIDFKEGAPVVWWPSATHPHIDNQPNIQGAIQPGKVFHWLQWDITLGKDAVRPYGHMKALKAVEEKTPELPQSSWLHAARKIDATPLIVDATPSDKGRRMPANQPEGEKFLYYDGLVPAPDFLRCIASDADGVVLRNTATFPLKDLIVIDRRNQAKDAAVLFAHLTEDVAPGKDVKIRFSSIAAKDWPATPGKEVNAALKKAGLTEAEAESVVNIWRDGFFNRPGLTAFYVLPQTEYDRMLPIRIGLDESTMVHPEITRVGIALHPSIDGEPALRKRVEELIAQLDSEDFKVREAASKALAEIGGIVFSILDQTIKETKSAEIKQRCTAILENFDARTYLTNPPKPDDNQRKFDKARGD